MSEIPVTVVATLRAKPGQEQALEAELQSLIPITRQEAGCLSYDLHRSVENPAVFVFHENWTSEAALESHLANDHLTAFMSKAETFLAEPPVITRLRKIG